MSSWPARRLHGMCEPHSSATHDLERVTVGRLERAGIVVDDLAAATKLRAELVEQIGRRS